MHWVSCVMWPHQEKNKNWSPLPSDFCKHNHSTYAEACLPLDTTIYTHQILPLIFAINCLNGSSQFM